MSFHQALKNVDLQVERALEFFAAEQEKQRSRAESNFWHAFWVLIIKDSVP